MGPCDSLPLRYGASTWPSGSSRHTGVTERGSSTFDHAAGELRAVASRRTRRRRPAATHEPEPDPVDRGPGSVARHGPAALGRLRSVPVSRELPRFQGISNPTAPTVGLSSARKEQVCHDRSHASSRRPRDQQEVPGLGPGQAGSRQVQAVRRALRAGADARARAPARQHAAGCCGPGESGTGRQRLRRDAGRPGLHPQADQDRGDAHDDAHGVRPVRHPARPAR